MLRVVLTLLCLSLGAPAGAADFDTEVIPILTRAGCNAGACHGAAAGRGGFKLSLLGTDPAADHDAITRDFSGRRVHIARPERSLVLLKPTGVLEHGGEIRLEPSGAEARVLEDWIRSGARRSAARSLTSLRVEPPAAHLASPGESVRLRVLATFSDGEEDDVTARTLLASDDPAIEVDAGEPGAVVVGRSGRSVVTARFLGAVQAVTVTVPIGSEEVDLSAESSRSYIDDHVHAALRELRLRPGATAGDRDFIRRASLALTGRLPARERVDAFVVDDGPAKRDGLVDELLATEAFDRYWAHRIGEMLRVRPLASDAVVPAALLGWLRDEVSRDRSLQRIARTLLLAEGDSHADGPAGFHRLVAGPRECAELVSEVFLGARLRCANCHDHPLDRSTQDDYHGLAAVFAGIERGRVVRATARGEVTHPRTGEPARARIPGERFVEAGADPRIAFADWLGDGDNRHFARALVNRIWHALCGRGLVEPIDDLRRTNPATHPALLDALAEDFLRHDASLRHIVRRIATSATFARSAVARAGEHVQRAWYTHATIRPLRAEVYADALTDVTDVSDRYGDAPLGTRAVDLTNPLAASAGLDVLGRCDRDGACTDSSGAGGLERELHLLNGSMINARLEAAHGRLARRLAANRAPLAIVEEFFERALSRPPAEEERALIEEVLSRSRTEDARRRAVEDVVWSLLASREFRTNH